MTPARRPPARHGPRDPGGETSVVRIETLAHGGDGVAREDGRPVVFVPDTAPGDRVRIAPLAATAGKRSFERATLVEVIEGGPWRRPAPCAEAGACGGCQWQHLSDEGQDLAIRQLLVSALERVGRIPDAGDRVAATRGLEARLAHRQRARLHLSAGPRPRLGFLRARSHAVHAVARCPVLLPELQDMTEALSSALAPLGEALRGAAAELQIDLPADGAAVAFLDVDAILPESALRAALDVIIGACPAIVGAEAIGARPRVGSRSRARQGQPLVAYRRGPTDQPRQFPAFAAPGGFLQASREGNALLIARVMEAVRSLGLSRGARVLELFAGDGNLSLPMASLGLDVTASDADARAVDRAMRAARACEDLAAPRHETADAEAHVTRLVSAGERFDLVVLDPPRTGARAACDRLAALGARAVVMVSCDAPTLARDAGILRSAGYSLHHAEPLAIFPQTAHFETVAVLTR